MKNEKIVNRVGAIALLSFGTLAGCTREQQESDSLQINISYNSSSIVGNQSVSQSSSVIGESQLEEKMNQIVFPLFINKNSV